MTQVWKRGISLLVAAALALCMLGAIPGTAPEAQAASGSHMKSLNLKWDLKKNKAVKCTEPFAAIGKKPVTVKIKNYKVTQAKKKGYKKLTFTVEWKRSWTPTKTQVHKAVNSSYREETGSVGGGYWYAITDYATGIDLETPNKLDVTVKAGEFKFSNYKKVTDSDDCWWRLPRTCTKKVIVTYPADYKGLCIGVGGYNLKNSTKTDEAFWNGEKPFGKTSYYKKGKTNSHWMRVK